MPTDKSIAQAFREIRPGLKDVWLPVQLGDWIEQRAAELDAQPRAAEEGEWVLVRKEAIDWLNGESDFECPPDRYFRGAPPKYWWRSVFREKAGLTAAPAADAPVESRSRLKRIAVEKGEPAPRFDDGAAAADVARGDSVLRKPLSATIEALAALVNYACPKDSETLPREFVMDKVWAIRVAWDAISAESRRLAAGQSGGVDGMASWPVSQETERVGDMGEGLKLQLFREDDGDIIVSVLPEKHKFSMNGGVQFCTAGSGGGRSEHTHAALVQLMVAMEKDAALGNGGTHE